MKNYIVWLSYFDCALKRRHGRRVPLSICLESPKPKEFLEACIRLGLTCEYLEKRYPRTWYKDIGCIVVRGVSSRKSELIKALANEVKNIRLGSKGGTPQHLKQ